MNNTIKLTKSQIEDFNMEFPANETLQKILRDFEDSPFEVDTITYIIEITN